MKRLARILTITSLVAAIVCGSLSADITGRMLAIVAKKKESPFVGPLDSYTSNLTGAWSVSRRLLTSYTGSLIRIRRSSDDTEQDIGYDGSDMLDTAAITTFVGANSAYIRTIYDQSGNSRDAGTSTTSLQPRIVNAGTLDTLTTGVPCAVWDGTDDTLACASLTAANVKAYSVLMKSTGATWNSYGSPMEVSADGGGTTRLGVMSSGSTSWHTDPTLVAVRKNGSSLSASGFDMTTINAAMCLGVDPNVSSSGATALNLGALLGGASYYLAYSCAEIVSWSTVADRTAFEADQKAHIGL